VFGDDLDQLLEIGQAVEGVVSGIEGAQDVSVEQVTGLPVLQITPDRAALARLGLNIGDIQEVVAVSIGGREAGRIFEGDRRFGDRAIARGHQEQGRRDRALAIPLAGNGASPRGFVPLADVAKVEVVIGPNQIMRARTASAASS
jgi:cobalt-zinc-cadmium resistance protein CzcA